jgi:RNA polymerase-binding transcription factor DksA
MTKDELEKLDANLAKEQEVIEKELRDIASENPLIKGDFDVKVEDIGPTNEDAAQEASELDRNQAMVDELERRLKEILNTREKIKNNSYSK